jgi:hypothetical protein
MEYTSLNSVLLLGGALLAAVIYLVGQEDWWKF